MNKVNIIKNIILLLCLLSTPFILALYGHITDYIFPTENQFGLVVGLFLSAISYLALNFFMINKLERWAV